MPSSHPRRSCPACGSDRSVRFERYAPSQWHVVQCEGCGFVFLANPPEAAVLEAGEVAWEKSFAAEAKRRVAEAPAVYKVDVATRRRTRLFRREEMDYYLRWFRRADGSEGGNVLDVGCGSGERVRAPFAPFGIEVSKALAKTADANMRPLGGYCLQGLGAEAIERFPAAHFDGILLRSYLEHETDPRRALAGAARVLKPSGAVYVKVPNYGSINRVVMRRHWCGFRHPDHVNYFTLASLRRMAEQEGFGVELINRWNLILDDNIHALLRPLGSAGREAGQRAGKAAA
ncbi:MAG: class I SAM-dependent methyltransferase [Pseudomonadota bacterium]